MFHQWLVVEAIKNILSVCGPELAHVGVVEEWDGTVDLVKVEGLGGESCDVAEEVVLDIVYMDGQRQTMGAAELRTLVKGWLGADIEVF
jgi:hypothetical protein